MSEALAREQAPDYFLGFLTQVQALGIATPRPFGSSVGVLVPEPLQSTCVRSVVTKWLVLGPFALVTFIWASK